MAVELVGNRLHSGAVDKCMVNLLSMHLSMAPRRLSINPRPSMSFYSLVMHSRAPLSYTFHNRIRLWLLLVPLANPRMLLNKLAAHTIRL